MWNGLDAAPTGRVGGGLDRDDGCIAVNVFAETAVDHVTASVTEMAVDDKGEPSIPFPHCRMTPTPRGLESNRITACIRSLI